MPLRFGDLRRYCEKNGWRLTRNSDHWYYEKVLADGTVLRTRISYAVHKEIPSIIWEKILHKQLKIKETEFWENI